MKKDQIKVGGLYTARVSGKHTTVRVDEIFETNQIGSRGGMGTGYDVTNLATGRKITFHSAAKFREEVKPQPDNREVTIAKCPSCNFYFPAEARKPVECPQCKHEFSAGPLQHCDRCHRLLGNNSITVDGDLVCADCGGGPISLCSGCGKVSRFCVCPVLDESEDKQGCPFVESVETTATATPPSSDMLSTSLSTEEGEDRSDFTVSGNAVLTESSSIVPIQTSGGSLATKIAAMQSTKVSRVPETVAGYTPTDEQRAILETVLEILNGDDPKVLVVNAGAGSGKTSTLKMLEDVLYGQIQYTAYNRPLVDESRTKFRKAKCSTSHGLAFGPVGSNYKHRLNGARVRNWTTAQKLGIEDYCVTCEPFPKDSPQWIEAAQAAGYDTNNSPPADFAPAPVKKLKAGFLAGHVSQALKKFSQTIDMTVGPKHFQYIPGIDEMDEETGSRSRANNDSVVEYLLPFARKFWDDVCDVDGTLPYQHDFYVKQWQLMPNCIIPADHILLDEGQDTAEVFADIIRRQAATVIIVEDKYQRIYEWRGAMDAAHLFPDAPVLYLSQSFRFGQVVADVANSVLSYLEEPPTEFKMKGLPSIPSRVLLDLPEDEYGNKTADDCSDQHVGDVCYLYRTNAGAVSRIITEYAVGRRGCLVGKINEVVDFVKAAQDLQEGRSTTHPELAVFENWLEVQKYVEEDPDGGDLKLMVKIIDQFGCEAILEALTNMPSEKEADFVCGTAHKSKGREWDTVVLGADFPPLHKMQDSDVRLLYVALTRPRLVLDLTHCTPFHTYKNKDGNEYPCIEVDYTVPMPSTKELTDYYASKSAPQIAAPKQPLAAPAYSLGPMLAGRRREPVQPNVASAIGNGQSHPPIDKDGKLGTGTYAKLKDGSWGLRTTTEIKTGQDITIVQRNGDKKQETVGRIVWFGNGVWLATKGGGSNNGGNKDGRKVCDECGKPGYLVRDLEDGGMKHRQCCDIEP